MRTTTTRRREKSRDEAREYQRISMRLNDQQLEFVKKHQKPGEGFSTTIKRLAGLTALAGRKGKLKWV